MKPNGRSKEHLDAIWRRVAEHTHLTTCADLPGMTTTDLLGVFLDTQPNDPMHLEADRLLAARLQSWRRNP